MKIDACFSNQQCKRAVQKGSYGNFYYEFMCPEAECPREGICKCGPNCSNIGSTCCKKDHIKQISRNTPDGIKVEWKCLDEPEQKEKGYPVYDPYDIEIGGKKAPDSSVPTVTIDDAAEIMDTNEVNETIRDSNNNDSSNSGNNNSNTSNNDSNTPAPTNPAPGTPNPTTLVPVIEKSRESTSNDSNSRESSSNDSKSPNNDSKSRLQKSKHPMYHEEIVFQNTITDKCSIPDRIYNGQYIPGSAVCRWINDTKKNQQ